MVSLKYSFWRPKITLNTCFCENIRFGELSSTCLVSGCPPKNVCSLQTHWKQHRLVKMWRDWRIACPCVWGRLRTGTGRSWYWLGTAFYRVSWDPLPLYLQPWLVPPPVPLPTGLEVLQLPGLQESCRRLLIMVVKKSSEGQYYPLDS